MEYKIHEKYEGADFWTSAEMPKGFRNVRNCKNCGKSSIAASGPDGITLVCNEVTEYQGVWDTGVPHGYSRQPSDVFESTTCDEHKYRHEMEDEK